MSESKLGSALSDLLEISFLRHVGHSLFLEGSSREGWRWGEEKGGVEMGEKEGGDGEKGGVEKVEGETVD